MAGKKRREPIQDTLGPVIRVSDIMNKYGCSKGKAINIIKHPDLHHYELGKELFCERQYWDAFINNLCDTGGTVTMGMMTGHVSFPVAKPNPISDFLSDILTDEEFGRFMDAVYEDNDQ